MPTVDAFTLISGSPYPYKGLLNIKPPSLDMIRQAGYSRYSGYLSVLLSTPEDFLEALGVDASKLTDLPTDPLIFMTLFPSLRNELISAVSFFIDEPLSYDEEIGYMVGEESLSLDDLRNVRSVILQMCCIEDTVTPPKKFRNQKARKIYELIQSRKAEQAKAAKKNRKENPDTALPNLISAFCAFSPSYNLINVWGLTIYQFYDQYHRLDSKIQLDVFGLRWAAWGKKDFDFSLWHKAPPKK